MITAADTIKRRLDWATQVRLVEHVRAIKAAAPFRSLRTPNGAAMSVRVTAAGRLGWTSDEQGYRYVDRDPSGNPWPPIPDEWIVIANSVVDAPEPWDSAILNWYGPEGKLGLHQDLSEADLDRPIVTISIGDSARWVVRQGERGELSSCEVRSGDVVVLAGVTRLWPHGITRINPEPLLSPLGATRGRISITIRVAGRAAA